MIQTVLLGIVTFLICIAIVRLAIRASKQWNSPKRQYQAQMEDIQRRKRELGIADEESDEDEK